MLRLWPRMTYEAPRGYVQFVERHIDELRRDAATVVGEDGEADSLYPEVLTDVAARWKWFERSRRWLGRSGDAEAYLRRAFQRRSLRWRSAQWRADQDAAAQVDVWNPEIQVWRDGELPPLLRASVPPPEDLSSTALRLAPHVAPERRAAPLPVADALVAWWHAYEAWRRRQVIIALAMVVILLIIGMRTSSAALSQPPPASPAVSHPAPPRPVVSPIDIHAGWG